MTNDLDCCTSYSAPPPDPDKNAPERISVELPPTTPTPYRITQAKQSGGDDLGRRLTHTALLHLESERVMIVGSVVDVGYRVPELSEFRNDLVRRVGRIATQRLAIITKQCAESLLAQP